MKKILSVVLLIALILSCCACAKKQEATAPVDTESVVTTLDPSSAEAMYGHIDQTVPQDGVYKIWNAQGVQMMADHPDGNFEILCDIDMEGAVLQPIGSAAAPFTGTVNGANFTIRNFSITASKDGYLGCVGVGKGNLQNVHLEDVTLVADSGAKYIGALAGQLEGNILRCYVTGSLTVESAAADAVCGSLAGKVVGDIKNTEVLVDITYTASGAATVAGIAGVVENGTLEHTQTDGTLQVTGSNKNVALFVGSAKDVNAYTLAFVGAENTLDGKLFTNYFGTEEAVTMETMLVRDNSREPEQPHIQEKRQKVADNMDAMSRTKWRPRNDMIHTCTCQLSVCFGTFKAEYTHFGPPYNHKGSSLYRMQYCVDEEGYLKPFVEYAGDLDGYDMYIGSDCSSATLQAYLTVGAEVWFTQTQNENPFMGYGTYAVGPYEYELGQDRYGNGRETKRITEHNGPEVMYESYAQVRLGDGVVYWNDGYGHSRVCVSDAVVVRDENGKINPDYSYIEMTEQGVETIDDTLKTYTSWRHHWKYTFANLYKGYYVPFTIKEFLTGEFEDIDLQYVDGSSDSRWSLTAGTITCNYSIDSVSMLIADDEGNVVFDHRLFTTVCRNTYGDGSTHARARAPYKSFDMSNFASALQQLMAFQQGESYHATITANLSTGDSIVVNDFGFTNG